MAVQVPSQSSGIGVSAPAGLAPGGRLVLEHGAAQGPEVRALLRRAGLVSVETFRDLADNERVTLGRQALA